ncbi:glycoside hydrolase family 3 protein [Cryptosporangium aurantiacum]|uniref:Glycosyl hydrolase family 3 N terminal domain-containing protein n=1 Tax=Cryptosporangium aurantiacum TaxID=134849 RepID=A0A1M7RAD9_9ACTN|nr:glycoside hydrolase family 3 N-terminal domain-containing protein [Cryptosporangium aurantiacum]SHN43122.1 Glycosyl hydrolase family 3 N terminal domain-containing protein [Cryptosporangium aurantiacum]
MNLETSIRLLSGEGVWTTQPVPEIGLRAMTLSDGPVGVRGGTDTELDPAAVLPTGSAMAASWDEDLLHRIGGVLAGEAVRKGVDVVLGPTINLHRSPRGGRHFECFSEDPLLSGRLATAYVRGVQENGVGACPKHYIANDAETDRTTVDNQVDERTLRELYLAPFEAVVADARPWMIMAAYNGVNGAPMTENDLLAEPLKGEWGFDGPLTLATGPSAGAVHVSATVPITPEGTLA